MNNKVSIRRLFLSLDRDKVTYQEDDVVQTIGDLLPNIEQHDQFEIGTKYLKVLNNRAQLPKDLKYIVELCKYNVCPEPVTEPVTEPETNELLNNCLDQELVTGTTIINRPTDYPWWQDVNTNELEPLSLSDDNFFSTIVCEPKIKNVCKNTYTIRGNSLLLSFKEGTILLAYRKEVLDEEGYPTIPETFLNTFSYYIKFKQAEIDMLNNREGSFNKTRYFKKAYEDELVQAISSSKMPKSVEEYKKIINNGYKTPPNYLSYKNRLK